MEADKKSKKKEKEEEEEEFEGSEEEEEEEEETLEKSPAMLDKYKAAAIITQDVLKHVTKLCVAGANIADICAEGDKKIEELVKLIRSTVGCKSVQCNSVIYSDTNIKLY